MQSSDKGAWVVFVAAVAGIGALIWYLGLSPGFFTGDDHRAASTVAADSDPTPASVSPWLVTRAGGRGSSAVVQACTTSLNELLQHSLNDAVKADLCLRSEPGRGKKDRITYEAILQVRGDTRLVCGREGCDVRVRVDDRDPILYAASPPSDGSANALLLLPRAGSRAVSEIGHSKRIAIEVTVYQSRPQVLVFDTHGLDYDSLFEPPPAPLRSARLREPEPRVIDSRRAER